MQCYYLDRLKNNIYIYYFIHQRNFRKMIESCKLSLIKCKMHKLVIIWIVFKYICCIELALELKKNKKLRKFGFFFFFIQICCIFYLFILCICLYYKYFKLSIVNFIIMGQILLYYQNYLFIG